MPCFSYGLTDPLSGSIRYIGISSNPKKRLETHLTSAASPLIREWVKDLSPEKPSLVILGEHANEDDARQHERELIAKHSKTILNSTPGGESPGVRPRKFTGIGRRIKDLREKSSMSGRELGRRALVSSSVISRIESGINVHIEAETAVLLARSLNTTVEYLVTGEQ